MHIFMFVAEREIISFEKGRKKNVQKNALTRTTAMQPFRSMVVWKSSARCSYFSCSLYFLCDIHWLMKEGIFSIFKLHHLFRAEP